MLSPFTEKEMTIQKEWRSIIYKKEEFKVYFHTWKCEDTGEQFEDDVFAQLNFDQVQNQYRAKYSIPFKAEIIAIREKYGLAAFKMSEVLGFGANSYRQYEAGEIPSQSNARLIQLSADPHEFGKLVALSNVFEGSALDKVMHKIELAIQHQKASKQKTLIEDYFFNFSQPCTYTGYRKPDFDKFAEMVFFFSDKIQPWKTKMNKLLFYSDFLNFKHTGFSISGAVYKAIGMGPVPTNFQGIYELLCNTGVVDINTTSFPDGGLGEQFQPVKGRQFNSSLFTDKELVVLNQVAERFKDTSTQNIIEISHQERACTDNISNNKTIDYIYAFDLK